MVISPQFMFGSSVWFSVAANRIVLFPVRSNFPDWSNPRWRSWREIVLDFSSEGRIAYLRYKNTGYKGAALN